MKTIHILGIVAAILLCAVVAAMVLLAPSGHELDADLANPSAVWCEEQGYEFEIRSEVDGSQYGVCIFPDGTEQDAWEAYYVAHPEDSKSSENSS